MKKVITLVLVACMLFTMMVPAFADNFTPSVSAKPAPVVKPQDGADAIIRNETTGEETTVPAGSLIVTPVSEREGASQDITDTLDWAYEAIKSVDSLSDLPSANGEGGIGDEINAVLAAMGEDLTVEDLVVRDLFDARLSEEYADKIPAEGSYIEIVFEANLKPDQTLVVISSLDNETWYCVDPANVTLNEDGTVTVRLSDLCAIAFLVDGAEVVIDPNAEDTVVSPKTGEF